jgi:subtilisin family serine protease
MRGVALLLLCAVFALAAGRGSALGAEGGGGRVIVQYRVYTAAQSANAPSLEEQGFRMVEVPPGRSEEEFLAELRRDPRVLSAEPDGVVRAAVEPNDTLYANNQAAYMSAIGAPAAWDLATGRDTIVVAVLDSGVDLNHPEFAGRLWENQGEIPGDGIDNDGNRCVDDRNGCRFVDITPQNIALCGYSDSSATGDVRDDHGRPGDTVHSHGSLVAGAIAAAGNNAAGITGVAWNVRIMPVKILDCGSGSAFLPEGTLGDLALGIDYARRMGANVINLSVATDKDVLAVRTAIEDAQAAGIIVVAASGNSGAAAQYPAAYTQFPAVVGVGSADQSGNWAPFSNYGPAIDLAAPGVNIAGTARSDLGLQNPYGLQSGTSMSAPLVSGMFALMMARNSRLSPFEYIDIARAAASPAPPAAHGQNWAGAGIINAGLAVARVPMILSGTALHDWIDVAADSPVRAFVGGVECGTTTVTKIGTLARYNLRVKPAAEVAGCGAPGDTVQLTINGLPAVPTFTWGGPGEDLALLNRDVSSVSPEPGPIVVQPLNGSWSNIAHLDPPGPPNIVLANLSAPWTEILRWDPTKTLPTIEGGYRHYAKGAPSYVNDIAVLDRYDAFWINASAANVATPNPNPEPGRAIALEAGWNNFTYTGANRQVADALESIEGLYEQVLRYDNTSGSWRSHLPDVPRGLNDFEGMFKLQVYWIYMDEPGVLFMD